MQRWEHLSQVIEPNDPQYSERLRKLGEQGWELTSATPSDLLAETGGFPTKIRVTAFVYLFKRPVEPPPSEGRPFNAAVGGERPQFNPR